MKCTNNKISLRKYKFILPLVLYAFCFLLTGCSQPEDVPVDNVQILEQEIYNTPLYQGDLLANGFCVANEDVPLEGFSLSGEFHGVGLFDVGNKEVLFASGIHEKIFPASTTKIMTALVALQHGNLSDTVTVGANADSGNFASGEQVCGLKEGDQLSLQDLMSAFLLHSGNDAGIAIAEHISGTEEAFVTIMNDTAKALFATNTNFVNSHGLHDDNHYTTVYDLYLQFQACITYPEFVSIINNSYVDITIQNSDGSSRTETFKATNYYASGEAKSPSRGTIIGGKTGTTNQAGSCLVLLVEDNKLNPYISIIMGAVDKPNLYTNMTALIETALAAPSETAE